MTTKKDGKLLDCREVEVMDQSPTSFYIQLWDSVMSYRADNWKPRETGTVHGTNLRPIIKNIPIGADV